MRMHLQPAEKDPLFGCGNAVSDRDVRYPRTTNLQKQAKRYSNVLAISHDRRVVVTLAKRQVCLSQGSPKKPGNQPGSGRGLDTGMVQNLSSQDALENVV